MPNTMQHWVHQQADTYLRHGGKTNRRLQVKTLINILEDIRSHESGVKSAHQVGKAHIHRYYIDTTIYQKERFTIITLDLSFAGNC